MCNLRRITHKLNIKPFGLYSVCELLAGVYTSIKSTKIKFIPIIKDISFPLPIYRCTVLEYHIVTI